MKNFGKLFLSLAILIGFFAFVSSTNAQTVKLSVDFNQRYFNTLSTPLTPAWIDPGKPRAMDNNIAIEVGTNYPTTTFIAAMSFDLAIESPLDIVPANDSIVFDFYDKDGVNETDKMQGTVNLVSRVGSTTTYHVAIIPVDGDLANKRQGAGGTAYQKFFVIRLNLATKMLNSEVLKVHITNILISNDLYSPLTVAYRPLGTGYPAVSATTFLSTSSYIEFTYEKVGDANGDGVVDIDDAIAGINHILGISTITDPTKLDELDMAPTYGVYDIFDIVAILSQMTLNGGPGGIVVPPDGSVINSFYDVDGQIVIFQSAQPFDLVTDLSGYKVAWNKDKTILGIDFGKSTKKTIELSSSADVQVSTFGVKPTGVEEQNQTKLTAKISPNPFTEKCQINFNLEQTSQVKLEIYNSQGGQIINLLNQQLPQGQQTVVFNGANLPNGFYFYRLTINGVSSSGKLNLIK